MIQINIFFDELQAELTAESIALQQETDGQYHPPIQVTPEQLGMIYDQWCMAWGEK